ncbi:MAG: hypothetical protein GXP35_00315 [Actinobacteria bacterium]|nr:hypothetical protein [Actinomycetota bacterium]
MSSNPTTTQDTERGLLATAGMVILVALVVVTVVFFVASAATDNLLVTPPGGDAPEEVVLGTALFAAAVGGVVGAVLAWATNRFGRRPRRVFVAVCVVGLVLYGIVPFTAAEQAATAVWLNVMHVAVAIPVVGGLAKYLPDTK